MLLRGLGVQLSAWLHPLAFSLAIHLSSAARPLFIINYPLLQRFQHLALKSQNLVRQPNHPPIRQRHRSHRADMIQRLPRTTRAEKLRNNGISCRRRPAYPRVAVHQQAYRLPSSLAHRLPAKIKNLLDMKFLRRHHLQRVRFARCLNVIKSNLFMNAFEPPRRLLGPLRILNRQNMRHPRLRMVINLMLRANNDLRWKLLRHPNNNALFNA